MSELEVTGTTLKGWDPQDPNKWSSSIDPSFLRLVPT